MVGDHSDCLVNSILPTGKILRKHSFTSEVVCHIVVSLFDFMNVTLCYTG